MENEIIHIFSCKEEAQKKKKEENNIYKRIFVQTFFLKSTPQKKKKKKKIDHVNKYVVGKRWYITHPPSTFTPPLLPFSFPLLFKPTKTLVSLSSQILTSPR